MSFESSVYMMPKAMQPVKLAYGDLSDSSSRLIEEKTFSKIYPVNVDSNRDRDSRASLSLYSKVCDLFRRCYFSLMGYTKVTLQVALKSDSSQTQFTDFYVPKKEVNFSELDKKVKTVAHLALGIEGTEDFDDSSSISVTPKEDPSATEGRLFEKPALLKVKLDHLNKEIEATEILCKLVPSDAREAGLIQLKLQKEALLQQLEKCQKLDDMTIQQHTDYFNKVCSDIEIEGRKDFPNQDLLKQLNFEKKFIESFLSSFLLKTD
jgi:hypothetical protein